MDRGTKRVPTHTSLTLVLRTFGERFANALRGAARFCSCKAGGGCVSLHCSHMVHGIHLGTPALCHPQRLVALALANRCHPMQSRLRKGRAGGCAADCSGGFSALRCTHAQILEERSGKLLSIIVPLKAKVRPLWLHGNHGHRIATTTVRHGSHTWHSLGCRRCQGTIGYYGRSHLHAHSHPHPGTLWQTLTRARPREASYRSPSQVNALHADTYPLADRPATAGAPKAKKAKAANVEKSAAKGAIVLHPALLAMEIEQFKREVAPPIGIVGGWVRACASARPTVRIVPPWPSLCASVASRRALLVRS